MATTKTKTEKIIEDITYASSNQSISRRVIYEFKNGSVTTNGRFLTRNSV